MELFVTEKNGAAIQHAIDKTFAAGGGKVTLENGVYPSGTLYLKSNVGLHIPAGAVILGSANHEDYDDFTHPDYPTTPENSRKALIIACEAENIAVTGNGEINGQGPEFYDRDVPAEAFFKKPQHPRPRMIQFFNCNNVRINILFSINYLNFYFFI